MPNGECRMPNAECRMPTLDRLPRLYPIVDVDLCRARGLDPLAVLAAFLDGGARFIQLRDKSPSSGGRLALADTAIAASRRAGARLIVNDRADIARLCGADGVHVGQDDLPVDDVRRLAGRDAIVGVSTHDEAQLRAAATASADYIAVGPIYGTGSKDTGYTARGLDLIRLAASMTTTPIVAIGGITLARAPEVIAAGAASVAVISDLLTGGDPAVRVRDYLGGLSDRRV
jgi:thiamine-phosphate pyrophosphorylase